MGLSRTVSEINGDFSRKTQKFPTPVYFAPLLKGFPLEFGIGVQCQKLEWWGYRADKEVWWYLQPSGYNPPTWRTDGQTNGRTDTGRLQRPRLRIASRGKNTVHIHVDKVSRKTHRMNGSIKQCQRQNFAITDAQKHYKNADSAVQRTTRDSQTGNVDPPPRHPWRYSRN